MKAELHDPDKSFLQEYNDQVTVGWMAKQWAFRISYGIWTLKYDANIENFITYITCINLYLILRKQSWKSKISQSILCKWNNE